MLSSIPKYLVIPFSPSDETRWIRIVVIQANVPPFYSSTSLDDKTYLR